MPLAVAPSPGLLVPPPVHFSLVLDDGIVGHPPRLRIGNRYSESVDTDSIGRGFRFGFVPADMDTDTTSNPPGIF